MGLTKASALLAAHKHAVAARAVAALAPPPAPQPPQPIQQATESERAATERPPPGPYRAARRTLLRAGTDLDSRVCGAVNAGQVVQVDEVSVDGAGRLRVRCAAPAGWASLTTRSGAPLLELLGLAGEGLRWGAAADGAAEPSQSSGGERRPQPLSNGAREALAVVRAKMRASSYSVGGEDWPKLFRHYDRRRRGALDLEDLRRAVRKDASVTVAAMSDVALKQAYRYIAGGRDRTIALQDFTAFLGGGGGGRPGGGSGGGGGELTAVAMEPMAGAPAQSAAGATRPEQPPTGLEGPHSPPARRPNLDRPSGKQPGTMHEQAALSKPKARLPPTSPKPREVAGPAMKAVNRRQVTPEHPSRRRAAKQEERWQMAARDAAAIVMQASYRRWNTTNQAKSLAAVARQQQQAEQERQSAAAVTLQASQRAKRARRLSSSRAASKKQREAVEASERQEAAREAQAALVVQARHRGRSVRKVAAAQPSRRPAGTEAPASGGGDAAAPAPVVGRTAESAHANASPAWASTVDRFNGQLSDDLDNYDDDDSDHDGDDSSGVRQLRSVDTAIQPRAETANLRGGAPNVDRQLAEAVPVVAPAAASTAASLRELNGLWNFPIKNMKVNVGRRTSSITGELVVFDDNSVTSQYASIAYDRDTRQWSLRAYKKHICITRESVGRALHTQLWTRHAGNYELLSGDTFSVGRTQILFVAEPEAQYETIGHGSVDAMATRVTQVLTHFIRPDDEEDGGGLFEGEAILRAHDGSEYRLCRRRTVLGRTPETGAVEADCLLGWSKQLSRVHAEILCADVSFTSDTKPSAGFAPFC